MPNWFYIFVNGLYLAGVSIWIGGGIVVTGVVIPEIFRLQPRHEAVLLAVGVLRRFARIRVIALFLMLAGAGIKVLVWERHEIQPWMAVRWGAIVLMAWALVVDLLRHRRLNALATSVTPQLPSDDPQREVLDIFRIYAEGIMRASLVAALIALLFS
ncbi:MAG TPA: hypothetical protein VNN25_24355 [Thermoanaerobaculia bacterium]|nr:hypothetical protein [Thermoanaerobaculia bacterium]